MQIIAGTLQGISHKNKQKQAYAQTVRGHVFFHPQVIYTTDSIVDVIKPVRWKELMLSMNLLNEGMKVFAACDGPIRNKITNSTAMGWQKPHDM